MTQTETRTYIGTCHRCQTFVRTDDVRNVEVYRHTLRADANCPSCPGYAPVTVFVIQGRYSETPCSEKCTDARGVKCDCQCGGHNHGATA